MVVERQELLASKNTDDLVDKSFRRKIYISHSSFFLNGKFSSHTDCNALPRVSPVCTVCSLPLLVYDAAC